MALTAVRLCSYVHIRREVTESSCV